MKTEKPINPADKIGRLASNESQVRAIVASSGGSAQWDNEAGTVIVTNPANGNAELLRAICKGEPGEPWIVIYNRDHYCPDESGHIHRIAIHKVKDGSAYNRVAVIDGSRCVPVDLLSLAAGSDRWLRGVKVRCVDCRKYTEAGQMECQLCPTCYDKAEAENAEANS